jgi:DegV family protein with EDD domain
MLHVKKSFFVVFTTHHNTGIVGKIFAKLCIEMFRRNLCLFGRIRLAHDDAQQLIHILSAVDMTKTDGTQKTVHGDTSLSQKLIHQKHHESTTFLFDFILLRRRRGIKEKVAIHQRFIYNDGLKVTIAEDTKMSKIAVMTDSNSGITQQEAGEMGVRVLPMPFIIDGEIFYEDISLSQAEFYERLRQDVTVSTSQPSVEDIINCWEDILEDADQIVYIPMSSGLSGSCDTATVLAQEFDGRVQVVDNQRISITLRQAVMDALQLAEQGHSAAQIKEILEQVKLDSSIYIMLDTLSYLKKGGRITPAAAALGTALRLKPVLQIQGEKLDAFSIARTKKQGIAKMLGAAEADINNRFGGIDNVHIGVAHTDNEEMAQEFVQEIKKHFDFQEEIICNPLSLSVSCHIGPGALAITVSQHLPEM